MSSLTGSTVVQWIAMLPHNKTVLGLNLPARGSLQAIDRLEWNAVLSSQGRS